MLQVLGVVAVAIVAVVAYFFGWSHRPKTKLKIGRDGHVAGDPPQLRARCGDQVAWQVTNESGGEVQVALKGFKRDDDTLSNPLTTLPSGRVPAASEGTITALVRDDAEKGRYRYAIELEPGGRHNTPEIKIMG